MLNKYYIVRRPLRHEKYKQEIKNEAASGMA